MFCWCATKEWVWAWRRAEPAFRERCQLRARQENPFSNVQLLANRSHQYAHVFDDFPSKEAVEKIVVIHSAKLLGKHHVLNKLFSTIGVQMHYLYHHYKSRFLPNHYRFFISSIGFLILADAAWSGVSHLITSSKVDEKILTDQIVPKWTRKYGIKQKSYAIGNHFPTRQRIPPKN